MAQLNESYVEQIVFVIHKFQIFRHNCEIENVPKFINLFQMFHKKVFNTFFLSLA